ncbi:hypothetical protein [Marinobacter sp. ELB17]|uniref:hypothetical protein n=1 Tax=Marinobacter sp. ELB17 TaxID=270374 RepID=UPI0000F36AAE|nr:hypothetical protein [Marinobacter sp. ELB17]EAZ97474.1 hypothetical protein MELB17_10013 [Marinobacter sp. ELB17]
MSTPTTLTNETDATGIYQVTVTTTATVSTIVNIMADSSDDANERGMLHVQEHGVEWALDECSMHPRDAYLPDPDSTEIS